MSPAKTSTKQSTTRSTKTPSKTPPTPRKRSATKRSATKRSASVTEPASRTLSVRETIRTRPPKSTLYEVRRSKIQGRGAFAIKPIRAGQIIDEYWGQKITHEVADRRYDDNEGRHHTFLFVLDDEIVLDARYGGNDARFLNHSCDPNCETEIEDGHIYIKAIKAIAPGTELVYDYRFDWQDEYEPEDVRYYACRCGSKKCRGTILRVPVYLRPTVREWLAGNDVKKPKKPVRGAKSKRGHPHVAERHATRGEKRARSGR